MKLHWAVLIVSLILAFTFISLLFIRANNNVVYYPNDVKSSQNGLDYFTEGF